MAGQSSSDPIKQRPLAPTADRSKTPAIGTEDLTNSGAAQDAELLAAARKLTELVQQQAPGLAKSIGVDLKDVEAANLRLADIAASGTGMKVEKGKFSGDIDIRGVRAGVPPSDAGKSG